MTYHGFRRSTIRQKATELLQAYSREHPERYVLPLDPLALAEFCGLSVLFTTIEQPNPLVHPLAKIIPSKRLIVVDERAYRSNPGQAHFSIGHELGHWVLYLQKECMDGQPSIFDLSDQEAENAGLYRTEHGWAMPSVRRLSDLTQREQHALADLFRDFDEKAVERAVDGFAAEVLMPADLIVQLAAEVGVRERGEAGLREAISECAARCDLSFTSMGIRLAEAGVIFSERNEAGRFSFSLDDPQMRHQLSIF